MTRRNDKQYLASKQFGDMLKEQTEAVTPPEHLDPKNLDQILVRGENLLKAEKEQVKKTRKQKRPMLYKTLAVALCFVLVVSLGSYAFQNRSMHDDISYTSDPDTSSAIYTTAKNREADLLSGTGMQTVAEYFGVTADDYTPLAEYQKELSAAVEEANKKTFFETVTETVDEAFDWGMKAEDSAVPETNDSTGASDSYSETNDQVANVQEGDIIKTNGRYIIVLSATGKLVCQKVEADGSLVKTDVLEIPADGYSDLREMFLYQDHIAVIVNDHGDDGAFCTKTMLYRLDADGKIAAVGSYMQKGLYVSGRVTEGALYLVTDQNAFSVYRNHDTTDLPLIWYDGMEESKVTTDAMYITGSPSYDMSYTNITGYLFGQKPEDVKMVSILGSGASEIYCTPEHLYLICTNDYYTSLAQKTGEQVGRTTSIYRYALTEGNVTASGEAQVVGWTLNQFSADEHNGYFRIATSDNEACRVTVFDAGLNQVSELKDLAKGERIYACKFMGDTAYLVTFFETDPLFVIDLKDVAAPKVLGELKIPGYSNYLYPLGENYLVGVGRNADENGSVNGLRINLFDVSDKNNPKLADVKILYGDGSILAAEDHKAYYADAKNGLFGFPLCTYQQGRENFDGFVMFSEENGKLVVKKEFNFLSDAATLTWDKEYRVNYAYNGFFINRAIYVNDTLYLLSNEQLYAYGRADFAYLNVFDLD